VAEGVRPVVSRIPRDSRWRVDFDRHDLRDLAALDEDDDASCAAALAASIFPTEDVVAHKGVVIGDVGARNKMRRFYGESTSSVGA